MYRTREEATLPNGEPSWSGDAAPPRLTRRRIAGEWEAADDFPTGYRWADWADWVKELREWQDAVRNARATAREQKWGRRDRGIQSRKRQAAYRILREERQALNSFTDGTRPRPLFNEFVLTGTSGYFIDVPEPAG